MKAPRTSRLLMLLALIVGACAIPLQAAPAQTPACLVSAAQSSSRVVSAAKVATCTITARSRAA